VLLRWQAAWVGRYARAVGVTARVRDALAPANPRRLFTTRGARTAP
jgi:hypothetical protein